MTKSSWSQIESWQDCWNLLVWLFLFCAIWHYEEHFANDYNSWENTFIAHLGQKEEETLEDEENDDQDDQETVDDETPLKVKTYKEANEFLEAQHLKTKDTWKKLWE